MLNQRVNVPTGRQIGGRSKGSEVQLLTQRAPKGVGRLVGPAVAGVCLVLLAAACTSFVCRPLRVTVAEKEERARLDTVSRGVETTATGRLEVLRAPEIGRPAAGALPVGTEGRDPRQQDWEGPGPRRSPVPDGLDRGHRRSLRGLLAAAPGQSALHIPDRGRTRRGEGARAPRRADLPSR